MPLFSNSRKLSSGSSSHSNSTHVNPSQPEAGLTIDGSGPLYPSTQREVEKQQDEATPTVFGDKSPGVRRIEIIGQFFTGWHKIILFFFIFLISCKSPSATPCYWKKADQFRCLRVRHLTEKHSPSLNDHHSTFHL